MLGSNLPYVRRGLRIPLWMVPMCYTVGSVLLGLTLPRLEHFYGSGYSVSVGEYTLALSVTSTQALLSSVASGMMALTAIVFSIAYITVQFSSMAYSPRLALYFARDPALFHSFGVFIATFVYALVTLAWVDRSSSGAVPILSVLLVSILLIVSMFLFARLVRGLNDLQVTNTLHAVGDRGREVIREMFERLDERPDIDRQDGGVPPILSILDPVKQTLTYHGHPRAIANLNIASLVRQAQAAGAVIVMDCAVGDTLVDDSVLLRVHGGHQWLSEPQLLAAIDLQRERTFEQDPKYPIRLLVDIAIKALSAAINDPTTAVQAIDQLEDLLRRLGQRDLDAGYGRDESGTLRLIFPMPNWEDYLRLSFDEIRHYGSNSVQVMRRLRAALAGISGSVPSAARKEAVQRYMKQLDTVIKRSHLDAQDRAVATQEDRQGLGLSRKPTEPKPPPVEQKTEPVTPP